MPYYVAAAVGAALWIATTLLTGRREAWDAGAYWSYAYPAGMVIAAAIGFVVPAARPWKIGLSMMFAQAMTLAFFARSFTLLPLGLILFGVMAAPVVLGATVGRAIAKWRS
jgi:hypothetical protein